MNESQNGKPLAVDPKAETATPGVPAFVARPEGAPVYHGFVVLEDVVVDGFTLGKITDFEAELCEQGDSFVIAPDGSRAGLVWEVCAKPYFLEIAPLEPERWGVWGVGFTLPMTNRDGACKNLTAILPDLKLRWAEWKAKFGR